MICRTRHLAYRVSVALLSFCFFSLIFIPQAHATVWDDITSGTNDIISIITNSIIFPAQQSFCNTYTEGVLSGSWKPETFFVSIGAKICSHVVITASISSSTKIITPNLTVVSGTINQGNLTPTATFVASTTPEAIAPDLLSNTATDGNALSDPEIFYWTNINRVSQGTNLSQLTENATLDTIAEIRVKDMFAKQYFEHVSPTGDNVTKEADANGYQYIMIGENIALGNFGSSRDLLVAWMNSPGHRANILNTNYTQIGVAAEQGTYQGQQVWIAAQIFGRPLSDCTEPDSTLKNTITSGTANAAIMLTNLTTMKSQIGSFSLSNMVTYNSLVNQYNTTAQTYDTLVGQLKTETTQYNNQVATFNACIQSK